jgi:hypothetical protein
VTTPFSGAARAAKRLKTNDPGPSTDPGTGGGLVRARGFCSFETRAKRFESHSMERRAMSEERDPNGLREIAIERIFVEVGRERPFELEDARNQSLVTSIQDAGIISPIEVRERGDRFAVVAGRRRLSAAKQVGLKTVPCQIKPVSDTDAELHSIYENLHRDHWSVPEQARAVKLMFEVLKSRNGADPGRQRSGAAGAAAVARDPETKKFARAKKRPDQEQSTADDSSLEPLKNAAFLSGTPPVSDEGNVGDKLTSHSELVSETTGIPRKRVEKLRRIVGELDAEQISALCGISGIGFKELSKLGKINEQARRDSAVALVFAGEAVEDAIALALAGAEEDTERDKKDKESQLPDSEWLAETCSGTFARLQDPSTFQREALLFRHVAEALAAFKSRSRKKIEETEKNGGGPLTRFLKRLINLRHPSKWKLCGSCRGFPQVGHNCLACQDSGYEINAPPPMSASKRIPINSAPTLPFMADPAWARTEPPS